MGESEEKQVVSLVEPMNVEEVEEKIKGMKAMVEGTEIKTDEDLEKVADTIKEVKTLGKIVKAEKERFTKPAMEIVNNAREKYLPFEQECKDAENALKDKADVFMEARDKKIEEEEARIAAKVEKGSIKEETGLKQMENVEQQKPTIKTESGAQLQRKMVDVAVIVDESKIPHEYYDLNEVRVRRAALAGAIIPGVEIQKKSSIASK